MEQTLDAVSEIDGEDPKKLSDYVYQIATLAAAILLLLTTTL